MKKKTNVKTMIRQMVREEVAMAIREVITELKQPSSSINETSNIKKIGAPSNKVNGTRKLSNNKILNEVLNETVGFGSDDYALMGDKVYDSADMDTIANRGNLSDELVSPNAPDEIKNIFNKDFSKILKSSYKKRGV